jgi:glycosyltransferase involved in cell wall biosynthesis
MEFAKVEPIKKDFTKKTIFAYGRWVKWKNTKQIFQTYEYLQKNKVSNLKLLVWWVWEELDFYKNKYKKDKNISFLWLLDNSSIIKNFQKSLVFLFPSKIDSFWMTILEAMSCGVPTIAFALNWAFEMIDNWKNGFLVSSSEEFSKKTLKLLTNQTLCKDFSKKSLEISLNFSESKFERQLENVF